MNLHSADYAAADPAALDKTIASATEGLLGYRQADGHFVFTAPGDRTVVVHGYEGEPYVKFQNGTIYVNRRSPTAYVNDEKSPPAEASAARWLNASMSFFIQPTLEISISPSCAIQNIVGTFVSP